jgi:TPR repeat protein
MAGEGIPEDKSLAAHHLKLAADQGHEIARRAYERLISVQQHSMPQ